MDNIDVSKVDHVVITFENFETVKIKAEDIEFISIEPSCWPLNMSGSFSEHQRCATNLSLLSSIENSPEILERLCKYRDITWFEILFKNDMLMPLIWYVAWEEDPEHEDENRCQRNNRFASGLSIYIRDYGYGED